MAQSTKQEVNMAQSSASSWRLVQGALLAMLVVPMASMGAGNPSARKEVDWTQSTFSGKSRPDALSAAEWRTYREDRLYVRGLVKPDQSASLDYSDPRVFRFVIARLKLAGKTPQTAPYLFQLINKRRAEGKQATVAVTTQGAYVRKDHHFLASTNFFPEPSPYVESNAVSTSPYNPAYLYADSAIWSHSGAPLGDMAYGERYYGPIVRAAALGDVSQTSENNYDADTYALIDDSKGFRDSYSLRPLGRQCEIDLSTLTVTDPADRVGGPCVNVCLNRTWTVDDCDVNLTNVPQALMLPLAGSMSISFNNPTCVFDAAKIAGYQDGTITPVPGFIKAVLETAGGGCDVDPNNALYSSMQNFWLHTTLSADNKTLTWNMTGADSAMFDASCRLVQAQVDLTMNLIVPYKQGAISLLQPVVISNDPDSTITDYEVPCITVTNSCLAAGTKIQMADGRSVPIESVKIGDRTLNPFSPDATAVTVVDTAKGFEDVPMVRIKDEAGRSLLMTEMHPILTVDRGMVQARKLRVGDKVQAKTGPSRLVSVTREAFSGNVYNLKVGTDTEALKLGADQTVMYADGFLVGDGQIQKKYELADQQAVAKIDMRKRMPKSRLKDYVSSATR